MKLCSLALLICCSALLFSGAITNAQQSTSYDVLIRNARVVDGTGSPWFRADIALRGQTIAAIGQLGDAKAARVIDAQGLVAAPGFIDIHTHSRRHILQVPAAENYVRQGVTTVFEGNDGSSPLPLGEFLDQLAAAQISINFGSFIGQGAIRREVLGNVDRAATPAELAKMKELARQGMRAGAFGLSTGLYYIPGAYTPTAEVVELARVVAPLGGIHISHMRDEAAGVVKSVAETIEIGERAGIPTQVTHHKIVGTPNWGRSVETLRLIAEARARGVDVSLDQYPYTASSTDLSALLPRWALEGKRADLQQRLNEPPTRARIKTETIENIKSSRGGGDPKNVTLAQCTWERALEGKTLAEISIRRGRTGSIEDGAETAMEIVGQGDTQAVFHAINEEDLVRILRDPLTMIGSDGEVLPLGLGVPHPRSYGTFARVLNRYVREQKALSLEEAIRKMTALPAQRVGLQERGLLRVGMKADLVLFAPDRVRDRATFAAPHQYAEGFEYVWVNGGLLLDGGKMTNARTGQVLRGPAMQR